MAPRDFDSANRPTGSFGMRNSSAVPTCTGSRILRVWHNINRVTRFGTTPVFLRHSASAGKILQRVFVIV